MSTLGEWGHDDDKPVVGLGNAPEAPVVGGLDVAAITQTFVDEILLDEVRRQVRKTVEPIVAEAVATWLTADRLDDLRDRAAQAAAAELAPSPDPAAAVPDEDPAPALYYGSVDEFVREMIVPVFSRQVGERAARRWQAEWWRSTEAIIRLEALWRSWEHLRLDPATGMSVWLRDHADHHLGVLMDPDGPWKTATDSARPGEPLPYTPPPEGLFPDVRLATTAEPVQPEARPLVLDEPPGTDAIA